MKIGTILLIGFLLVNHLVTFSQKTTKIKGYAPAYIGQKIEIFEIEDYFSMREALVASTTVEADSSFSFQFYNDKTQKVILKSKKNKGYIYIQPNAEYEVFLPEKNQYDAYRPDGNEVEISFFDLDSTDINYKILSFDKWVNNFLGTYFPTKNVNGLEFVAQLDTFKRNVEKAYQLDTNFFFKTYVKYSIATLDDIQFRGSRNRYEKFDFYINNAPVVYECDVYMKYISSFYEHIFARLEMEVNNQLYLGLLKNSPSLMMRALGDEYTLRPIGKVNPKSAQKPGNTRLRELILIKGLSEVFYTGEFPQTNILSVLDSMSKFSIFKTNAVVAKNIIYRLTELVPGSKAPAFSVTNLKGEITTLTNYSKKHLYLHFFDPTTRESAKELELLKALYQKYSGDVNFLSIYPKNDKLTKKQRETLMELPWECAEIEADHPIINAYHVESFPLYGLIDAYGYIVNLPALGPKPNGEYITIDKSFFDIQKINQENK
jgi:hypothetical protein